MSTHVLELDPLEVAFELLNLSAVSIHCVFEGLIRRPERGGVNGSRIKFFS
jgi:hypothetical protein